MPPFDEAFARAYQERTRRYQSVNSSNKLFRQWGFGLTSAASAAFFRASLGSLELLTALPTSLPAPPSVRGGPPTFGGTRDVFGPGGGAEPRGRPG